MVWSHNFESDTEVTAHLLANQTMDSVRARRVVDSSGIGCLEQIALGATLAANYTAGSPTMVINDTTHWPDPAVTGPFEFQVCRAHPSVGNKNGFMCTARSGTTLTVTYIDYSGVSAYASTPQSYVVGDYAGSEASDWRRTFAALPAGENGKAVDDPGASGAVPLRSKLSGNAYSVPRDTSLWQYGWYGHPSNQTTWADWTGWGNSGTTKVPLTPRGVSQGAAAKFRLWDGDEFYIQWRQKVDPRFYVNHAQPDPNGETSYWGRKAVAIQSELASVNQIVMSVSTSNRYSIPDTTKAPVSLATYKAARVIGVSDYPSRVNPSNQKNSPWDVAPHFANLSSSFKPSTGLSTPDGSTAWELPDNEWVTFYLRVKPGRSGVAETEIELKFARTEDPAYTEAYTTLMNVMDANIVYSGSGDYDYPDGAFDHPAVTVMNALPGFQAFGIMGYFNITQSVGIPPAKASYYVRLAQVIFSKAAIAPPASDVVPAWAPAAGSVVAYSGGGSVLTNNFISQIAPYYEPFYSKKIVNDYSSAIVNPYAGSYGGLLYFGGGHAGTNDNSVIGLSVTASTLTFVRLADPTPYFGTGTDSTTKTNNGNANVSALTDGTYGDPLPAVDSQKRAPSNHTYGHGVVVPPAGPATYGTFFSPCATGGPAYNSGNFGSAHTLQLASLTTPASNGWVRSSAATFTITQTPAFSAYVNGRTFIVSRSGGAPLWYDHATDSYVTGTGAGFTNLSTADDPDSGALVYIEERSLLVLLARKGGVVVAQWMDVSVAQPTLGGTATLSASLGVGSSGTIGTWANQAFWCADSSRIVVGKIVVSGSIDTAAVYEIQIPATVTNTWTVTRQPFVSGTIPWSADGSNWQRMAYLPSARCALVMFYARDSGADTIYAFRPHNT